MDSTLQEQRLREREEWERLQKQRAAAEAMRQQQQQQQGPPPGAMQAAGQGGGGDAMAAAGPWAALAAAIIANETYQNKSGNRPEDFGDHMQELATGEVMERDGQRYLGDTGEWIASHGNPEGMYQNILRSLKPWEWF